MIYDFHFICKILILKKAIKLNQTIIKIIQIKYISDISSIGGYRQNFSKSYYGIKIFSNRKTYLIFYKNILNEMLPSLYSPFKKDSTLTIFFNILVRDSNSSHE